MEPKKTNPYLIPGAILLAGIIIAGALYMRPGTAAPAATGPTAEEQQAALDKLPPVSSADHILGNPQAKIKIVEYSDLECPFCKAFHGTMTKIMDQFGASGEVAWVYRHFPIDSLHPISRNESYAAECAVELGGEAQFWPFMNGVMAITPSNNGLDPAELPKIATKIGLNETAFRECLKNGTKYESKINAQIADAIATGAQGTPWSIMLTPDGKKIPINGAVPYDQMLAAVKEALGKK